ncbi:hypothetical protein ACLMJK_001649 [Lecanora helva]
MAEALGIVTGVIGLLPICANGCLFIEKIITADRRVKEQMDLDAWGRVWEVPKKAPEARANFKLQRWVDKNQDMGAGIVSALIAISNLFADSYSLQEKYGMHLKQKDPALQDFHVRTALGDLTDIGSIHKKVETRRQHMNILKRCHFELRGVDQFEALVERLKEFITTLRNICSEAQAMQIDRGLPGHISSNQDPDSLEVVSRVYDKEVKERQKIGRDVEGTELIRDIAAFKARVQKLAKIRSNELKEGKDLGRRKSFLLKGGYLEQRDFEVVEDDTDFATSYAEDSSISLALSTREHKICYVEWKAYAHVGEIDKIAENDIMALSDFFGVKDRPKAFRVLPFLGIFRDKKNHRFGFVYQQPQHTKTPAHVNVLSEQVKSLWRSESLLERLEKDSTQQARPILPLGDRFQLARNIAQCVYSLHAAGWVHKNIRASSVVFLPSNAGGETDISYPYLCGFGHSRPGEHSSLDPGPGIFPGRGKTKMIWNIKLDEYHHPSKRGNVETLYTQAFDLYSSVIFSNCLHHFHKPSLPDLLVRILCLSSDMNNMIVRSIIHKSQVTWLIFADFSLGVVLLEIGLWQPLIAFAPNVPGAERLRNELIDLAAKRLPGQVGKIYTKVVMACLRVRDDEENEGVQELLYWEVIAALDDCNA